MTYGDVLASQVVSLFSIQYGDVTKDYFDALAISAWNYFDAFASSTRKQVPTTLGRDLHRLCNKEPNNQFITTLSSFTAEAKFEYIEHLPVVHPGFVPGAQTLKNWNLKNQANLPPNGGVDGNGGGDVEVKYWYLRKSFGSYRVNLENPAYGIS